MLFKWEMLSGFWVSERQENPFALAKVMVMYCSEVLRIKISLVNCPALLIFGEAVCIQEILCVSRSLRGVIA
jgi:hypothetical protein